MMTGLKKKFGGSLPSGTDAVRAVRPSMHKIVVKCMVVVSSCTPPGMRLASLKYMG